jgi:hypothetical protein
MSARSLRISKLLVLLAAFAILLSACAEEARRKKRSSGDDDGNTGGAAGGISVGGNMTVPGGPEITSLTASPTTLTEHGTTTITAMVIDPDGLDDLVGGVLTDESGAFVFGAFTQLSGGTFAITVSWWALQEVESIDFDDNEITRTLVARFSDTTQKEGVRSVPLTLTCDGKSAIEGYCSDCLSCQGALNQSGYIFDNGYPCEIGSTPTAYDQFSDLFSCACEVCYQQCQLLCYDYYAPPSATCQNCMASACGSQLSACK